MATRRIITTGESPTPQRSETVRSSHQINYSGASFRLRRKIEQALINPQSLKNLTFEDEDTRESSDIALPALLEDLLMLSALYRRELHGKNSPTSHRLLNQALILNVLDTLFTDGIVAADDRDLETKSALLLRSCLKELIENKSTNNFLPDISELEGQESYAETKAENPRDKLTRGLFRQIRTYYKSHSYSPAILQAMLETALRRLEQGQPFWAIVIEIFQIAVRSHTSKNNTPEALINYARERVLEIYAMHPAYDTLPEVFVKFEDPIDPRSKRVKTVVSQFCRIVRDRVNERDETVTDLQTSTSPEQQQHEQ